MATLMDQSSFYGDKTDSGTVGVKDPDETVYYDLRNNSDSDPTTGSEAEINGALFFTDQPATSAGTGLIQAFVRVQDGGNDDSPGFENGYNTSERPLSYEENTSPTFTKSLLLNQVPIVTIDGVDYYEFRLDINQLNSSPLLSLDALKLYTSDVSDGELSGEITDPSFNVASLNEVYDLDGIEDSSILLDYSLQAGSGKSDMFFYVPVSDFGGVNPDETYVTLYSEFGDAGTLGDDETLVAIDDPGTHDDLVDAVDGAVHGVYTANDGFEEWSVSKELTLFVSGFKWEDSDGDGIWDVGENGLADWQISYEYTVKIKGVDVPISGTVETADGVTDDLDGDGVIDDIGFYVIPLDFGNKNYTVTITETAPGVNLNTNFGDLDGWINTYAGDGTADGVITYAYNKNTDPEDLPQGEYGTAGALDFGNFDLFDISGTKYEDSDGDGSIAGESGLLGWTIFIDSDGDGKIAGDTDEDGVLDMGETWTEKYAFTAADGSWSITGLDASYNGDLVKEVTKDGWVQTLGPVSGIVATSGNDQSGFDFANFANMMISGYKWADVDASETWNESNTAVLSGWTIILDFDDNPDNGYIASAVTNGDGYYEFTGLNPFTAAAVGGGVLGDDADGILHVYELQQDGFTQTYGGFTFDIESGLIIAGDLGETEMGNFGNYMMEGANRTPGFWQSTLGSSFYDGIPDNQGDANGDGVPDGNKNFEEEGWSETDLLLLYGKDTDSDGIIDRFEIWGDGDNSIEAGEIFLTPEELHGWVSGGEKGGGRDFAQILERDLGAAFLNSINNDAIGGDPGGTYAIDPEILDSYEAAVVFINEWDPNFDGMSSGGSKKAQKEDWNDYGSDAHNELSAFNENGEAMIEGAFTQILMDGDDVSSTLVQNYMSVQNQLLMDNILMFSSGPTIEDDMMLVQTNTSV